MPTPDAIKGWKRYYVALPYVYVTRPPDYHDHSELFPDYHVDQTVIDDYQAFAHQVWPEGQSFFITEVDFYEDGNGKHAVRIELEPGPSGHIEYYLLYDRNNVRIQVIKGKTWYPFHGFG